MSKRDKAKEPKKAKAKIVAKPLPTPTSQDRSANLRIAKSKAAEKPASKAPAFAIKPPDLMPGVVPAGKQSAIAMDYAPGVYDFASQCFGADFQGFPGYPYLANLATRAEYRAFASTMASELFREGIKLSSKTDANRSQDNPRIAELEEAIKEFNLLHVFQTVAAQECFFGRGQISINIKGAEDDLPLVLAKQTVKQGSLTSFTPVEAMWTSPSAYNAIDPTAPDFYKPRQWFLLGKEVHASRLLTIITRPLPDMLKPAYNFSGMSLSQLAEPYVNNWLRTRQAVSDLINNFSITALKTDMGQMLQGSCDGQDVLDRADFFTLTRSNRGLMLLDNTAEELVQLNTPLSGLHELQAQAQEHQCLSSGTLIETRRGQVAIENVKESDEVMTRDGYAPVEWVGVTGTTTQFVEIEIEGSILRATKEHPVWSETKNDFVPAKSVDLSHRLRKSRAWVSTGNLSRGEAAYGAQQKQGTTGIQRLGGCSIESFTKRMLGRFQEAMMSITRMRSAITTHSKILRFSQRSNTQQSMGLKDGACLWSMPRSRASNAGKSTKQSGLLGRFIALAHARLAHGYVEVAANRVSVVDLHVPESVYNIKVADGFLPEYYANGVLVHNCSVVRIPAMILTGISPTGMNASSEGEIRSFYDWVSSQQESFYRPPMWICIQLLMLHLWGEIDPTITFEFNPLWQVSAKEQSDIRVNNANADAVYLDRSVVSPEETRERLAKDPDSGYSGIDVDDLPEVVEPDVPAGFGGDNPDDNTEEDASLGNPEA